MHKLVREDASDRDAYRLRAKAGLDGCVARAENSVVGSEEHLAALRLGEMYCTQLRHLDLEPKYQPNELETFLFERFKAAVCDWNAIWDPRASKPWMEMAIDYCSKFNGICESGPPPMPSEPIDWSPMQSQRLRSELLFVGGDPPAQLDRKKPAQIKAWMCMMCRVYTRIADAFHEEYGLERLFVNRYETM